MPKSKTVSQENQSVDVFTSDISGQGSWIYSFRSLSHTADSHQQKDFRMQYAMLFPQQLLLGNEFSLHHILLNQIALYK